MFASIASLERSLSGFFTDLKASEDWKAFSSKTGWWQWHLFKQSRGRRNSFFFFFSLEDVNTDCQELLLTISKGKGEEESDNGEVSARLSDDSGVSDSSENSGADESKEIETTPMDVDELNVANMPLPPSALCDCHGEPQCPGWEFTCSLCLDSFVPGPLRKYHASNCHSLCCETCLKDSLSFNIRNGNSKPSCVSCGFHLTSQEVARRLDPEDVERYHRFLLRRVLQRNPKLHECKNPGCENAVLVEDECALKTWKCEACDAVCPWCQQAGHPDKKCEAMKRFEKSERSHKRWVALSASRKCPSCKTPTLKNGGCPHMNCKACGHQYCWLCRQDWATHDMCAFAKVAVVGIVVISPIIVALGAAVAVTIIGPAMGADAMAGHKLFNGRPMYKKLWRAAKDLYYEFR